MSVFNCMVVPEKADNGIIGYLSVSILDGKSAVHDLRVDDASGCSKLKGNAADEIRKLSEPFVSQTVQVVVGDFHHSRRHHGVRTPDRLLPIGPLGRAGTNRRPY